MFGFLFDDDFDHEFMIQLIKMGSILSAGTTVTKEIIA